MSALLLVLYIVKEIDRSLFFSYSYLKESKSKSVNISPNVPFLFFNINASNSFTFDNVLNEMLLEWKGQMYVIKSTAIKYDGSIVTNEVVAKHIFMEFQNHYIQKDLENEELNGEETTDEETKTTMTLEQQ